MTRIVPSARRLKRPSVLLSRSPMRRPSKKLRPRKKLRKSQKRIARMLRRRLKTLRKQGRMPKTNLTKRTASRRRMRRRPLRKRDCSLRSKSATRLA
jgi:hypothetical protein